MRGRRSVGDAAIAAATVLAVCCGAWLLHSGGETHAPPQPSPAQAGAASPDTGSGGPRDPLHAAALALAPSPPDRMRIPSIRVDAPSWASA